ncbi:MAG TPA: HAD family phosphatase [Methylomirabilota bacterium]|nr:HAD family phosphatase [Methylomirabilota bacterium]
MTAIAAVVFDLGGVVQDSPLHAIARYERDHALPPNAINRAVAATGEQGAWSRLERGELTLAAWCAPFEADCRTQGVDVDATRLMEYIAEAGRPRPQMLRAIARLRERRLRVGALTNNWARGDEPVGPHPLAVHFDAFVESRAVGMRKPDPRIYQLICRELGVEPPQAAFLDDIGSNLKSARALGMHTIKVDDPDHALRELGTLVGFDLLG